jgi:hypothetical protein
LADVLPSTSLVLFHYLFDYFAGIYLQQKLPLDNPVLINISALDPNAHGHSASLKALKKLVDLIPCRLTDVEKEGYDLEVHR